MACDSEGFLPPKVMLISSKVPKAEYIPTIIRRDDPSIIPILYVSAPGPCPRCWGVLPESGSDGDVVCLSQDHEHATFEDILGTCPLTPLCSGPGLGDACGPQGVRWGTVLTPLPPQRR